VSSVESSFTRLPDFRWLSHRLPTRHETWLVFVVSVIPVHIWAWLVILNKVPSYLLSFSFGQIIAVLAYVLSLALFESLLLSLFPIFLAFLLPRRLFLDYFVAQSTLLVATLSAWFMIVQYRIQVVENEPVVKLDPSSYLLALACLGIFIALAIMLRYLPRWNTGLLGFADRLSVLSTVYVLIDLCALVIVVLRNIAFIGR
jgi:hypothetical protein